MVVFLLILLLFLLLNFLRNDESEYEYTVLPDQIIFETGSLETFEDIDNGKLADRSKYDEIIDAYKRSLKQAQTFYTRATNINYYYFPASFQKYMNDSMKLEDISTILFSPILKEKDLVLDVEMYQVNSNVRGRYQHGTLKFFDIEHLSQEELVSVFIHELGHYFDIKYLEKQVLFDLSDKFYGISWQDVKVLSSGSEKKDFVSGYAMTNKYEDFAESFTYYILFNTDFRSKMIQSPRLQQKYEFFEKYVFRNDEFKKTNFRSEKELADYYRDTTKIKISLQNFLDYFKK